MSGSGISWPICKSAPRSRQITTPALHRLVFTGRMPFLSPNQQRQSTEGKLQTTSSTQTCFRLSFSIVWSTLVISRSTRCMFWTSSSLECRIWFSRALSTGSVGEIASTCGLYAEEPVSWFCTFTDNKYNSLYSYVSWQHDIACICCWMTCYYPLCCCGTRQLPISINMSCRPSPQQQTRCSSML